MFTQKRTLLFLTVTVILSLVLAACQPANPGEPVTSTSLDAGKNITIVIAEDPPSFNPMVADTGYDALVMELVMLGLTDVDPQSNVFPELAAELPSVENGGVVIDENAGTMSVTWRMRQDVQWQDSKPVTAISLMIGVPIGALAGYYGGKIDSILMRFTDAFLSLPPFLVLILLASILREVEIPLFQRNSVLTISLVIGILSWMTFARLVRAAFLTLRELDYVSAARALGSSDRRIILGHILPNGIGVIIVEATLQLGYAIIQESGLSFLGFGIQQPTPSWGNLIASAQDHFIKYP
jgi:hypothetical protein